MFKQCTGMGFKEYVTAKRLDQAYKLLKSTSDSISDIAKAVGIDNTKYFFTLFKKHYGQSPQQMRGKD
jgi:YesN/AraC family two-component response regulator